MQTALLASLLAVAVAAGPVPAQTPTPAPAPAPAAEKKEEEKPKTYWEEHKLFAYIENSYTFDLLDLLRARASLYWDSRSQPGKDRCGADDLIALGRVRHGA